MKKIWNILTKTIGTIVIVCIGALSTIIIVDNIMQCINKKKIKIYRFKDNIDDELDEVSDELAKEIEKELDKELE